MLICFKKPILRKKSPTITLIFEKFKKKGFKNEKKSEKQEKNTKICKNNKNF